MLPGERSWLGPIYAALPGVRISKAEGRLTFRGLPLDHLGHARAVASWAFKLSRMPARLPILFE